MPCLWSIEVGNAPIPPEPDDGKVSLEEFKMLATHGIQFNLKSSALWSSVRQVSSLCTVL